ncbi:MAG TPA: ABC transporter permease [Candidatus Thermoplasmatota archaeon]|nr:ABC transporter permease [Candidatus Thermoplasmatota archaeon]
MSFRAVLRKDARILARSPILLGTLLLYPLLLVLVVGLAFANPPDAPTLAVVNGDADSPPETLGGREYTTQHFLDLAGRNVNLQLVEPEAGVAPEETARRLVREGRVDGALFIPKGFLRDAKELGKSVNVTLIVDESDPLRAGAAEAAVRAALQQFGTFVVNEKIEGVKAFLRLAKDGSEYAISVADAEDAVRTARDQLSPGSSGYRGLTETLRLLQFIHLGLNNSEPVLQGTAVPIRVASESVTSGVIDLRDVVLPAAATFSIFWAGTLAASAIVAEEREGAAYRRVRASPTPFGVFLAAKGTLTLLLVVVQAVLLVLVADLVWARPPAPHGLVALALAAAALAAAGLGVFLASFARSPGEASLFSVLALVPQMFVAGVFYPLAYMPEAVAAVARWLPMTQAATLLREVMLKTPATTAESLAALAPLFLGLLALAALFFGLGAWLQARRAS